MIAMASSPPNSVPSFFEREKLRRLMPEEAVRQKLLEQMIKELGYPRGLIAVEKEIKYFTKQKDAPKRRIDLLCFDRRSKPLLLIECKAKVIDSKALAQVLGYNAFIQAPIVGLAQPEAILLGFKENKEQCYKWVEVLPSFDEMVRCVKREST